MNASGVFGIFVGIFVAVALPTSSGTSGPCGKIRNHYWSPFGSLKTCDVSATIIDSPGFLITSNWDEAIEGFYALSNRNLEFLPKNIGETFPSLIILIVNSCAIKEISKENFNRLDKLRKLSLKGNQIEKIDDDTFDGIPAVEQIHLDNNKIKKLNSRAFASLNKLKELWLSMNHCINENFWGEARFPEMSQAVDSKCGFNEPKGELATDFFACGVSKNTVALRITLGENFEHGDFPWMVALYRKLEQKQPEYFCGSTLISDRHVLTAAHCLEGLLPRHITAVFGAYDLDDLSEGGRSTQSPSKIFVNDQWKPQNQRNRFDADIAMLLMPQKIIFSNFVQPICLWESQTEPAASTGTIAGWGQNTSRGYERIPTTLKLLIHTNENCFLTHPYLGEVSSNRTFCAGSGDGRGPCFGDSGGGFYVQVLNVYYLRGIVSCAWDVNEYGQCLLKMYTIYTNVVKFKAWIDNTMASN